MNLIKFLKKFLRREPFNIGDFRQETRGGGAAVVIGKSQKVRIDNAQLSDSVCNILLIGQGNMNKVGFIRGVFIKTALGQLTV